VLLRMLEDSSVVMERVSEVRGMTVEEYEVTAGVELEDSIVDDWLVARGVDEVSELVELSVDVDTGMESLGVEVRWGESVVEDGTGIVGKTQLVEFRVEEGTDELELRIDVTDPVG
jgi:hypothetical protein